jgi:hypothetical protein
VLLLAALAASAMPTATPQARATVRILRPVRVSKDDWLKLPAKQRREVVAIRDGQPVKLRLMEFE